MTARVLAWVLEQLQHNSPVVLASVVGTKGSVPGKSGARLAMNRSQNWVGTVGGAGLEHRILKRCKELLQEKRGFSKHCGKKLKMMELLSRKIQALMLIEVLSHTTAQLS